MLNPKELRMAELAIRYEQKNLQESLAEFHHLLDTLLYVNEAVSESQHPVKRWQKTSETLLFKFILHGYTIHNILSGFTIQSEFFKDVLAGKKIIDFASAKTILRAQLETFLMYQHIYVNPETEELKELRYEAWIYSALLSRQDFPAETAFGKQRKSQDLEEINKLRGRISMMPAFLALSEKQQKNLLDKGSGKLFNHWATILKETGFSTKNPFYWMYALLSMYAHSEGLSIIQMENNGMSTENMEAQAFLDLHHSKLLVCLMVEAITDLFPPAKERFDKLPESTRYDIELYCLMAMREKSNAPKDQ